MDTAVDQTAPLWPLAVYCGAVLVTVVGTVVLSFVLGERHRERATGQPYESGIVSTGSARLRFSADFYLVAMFFVIFDLESVFIFTWAVSVRQVGWAGWVEAAVFIGVLVAALLYLWAAGALDWGPSPRPPRRAATGEEQGHAETP